MEHVDEMSLQILWGDFCLGSRKRFSWASGEGEAVVGNVCLGECGLAINTAF